jgi:hypothetical protein
VAAAAVIAEPSGGRDNDCRGDTDNDDDGAKAEQQQQLPLCIADRLATASTAQTSLVTVVRPDISWDILSGDLVQNHTQCGEYGGQESLNAMYSVCSISRAQGQ